jgi:hypothetical protein
VAASTSAGFVPGLNRADLAASRAVESPCSSLFSPSEAVTNKFWSWLAALASVAGSYKKTAGTRVTLYWPTP